MYTLILADEPTGALDSETGESKMSLLRERCDEGAGGLLATHDARNAAWADRIVFLPFAGVTTVGLTGRSILVGRVRMR